MPASVLHREDRFRLVWLPEPNNLAVPSCHLSNVNSILRSMREVEAAVTLVDDWQPVELYHVAQGLRWTVVEVLDGWTHPRWPGKTYKKPVVEKWYRLRVFGPLPGRPG
jgi:hypothetical protein